MGKRHATIITLLILTLLGWGLFLYQYFLLENKDKYHGFLYYKQAPNFTLTDHNGKKVTLSEFRGKLILINWGYTRCPDICFTTLSVLRDVMKELGELENRVQVVFVTIDPEMDTVEKLGTYIPYFNKSFIGLTGTPQEIEKVAQEYNVFYLKNYSDSWPEYLMDHTSSVYLIDPQGRLFLIYTYDKLDSKAIAKDIKKILK